MNINETETIMKNVRKESCADGRSNRRRASVERLESRSLMAADLFHNFAIPEDADGSGAIDPLDALIVVNQLNQGLNRSSMTNSTADQIRFVDIDADDSLTPLDVLAVINHINSIPSDSTIGLRASNIDLERRVSKIEWSLANNSLPPSITTEDAVGILATLKCGGRPELGDRVVDGYLQSKHDLFPEFNDPTGGRHGDPTSGNESPSLDRWIGAFSNRLVAFGVSAKVISAMTSEIEHANQLGNPMGLDMIVERLKELGVDVAGVFPQFAPFGKPGVPEQPEQPDEDTPLMPAIVVTEPVAESILARLRNAGIDEKVIAVFSAEIWGAIHLGMPMDLLKARERLEELGVDWDS